MKVFVVSDNLTEADGLARMLADAGHGAIAFHEAESALKHVAAEAPQAVLLESAGRIDAASFLLQLQEGEHDVYKLLLASSAGKSVATAFELGADDVLRRPYTREEVCQRLCQVGRLQQKIEREVARRLRLANENPLAHVSAWRDMETLSASELGEMVGIAMAVGRRLPPGWAAPTAAAIVLSLAEQEIDIPITLQADSASLATFGETLLGAPVDLAAHQELLLEVTNTVAGAFKRRALNDGIELATGLPVALDAGHATTSGRDAIARRNWFVQNAKRGICMSVEIAVRRRVNHYVSVAELREGLVLARELRNKSGLLLMASGLRLTHAAIRTIRGVLGEDQRVQVSSAEI